MKAIIAYLARILLINGVNVGYSLLIYVSLIPVVLSAYNLSMRQLDSLVAGAPYWIFAPYYLSGFGQAVSMMASSISAGVSFLIAHRTLKILKEAFRGSSD